MITSTKPLSLPETFQFLQDNNARLPFSYEIQRMQRDGFDFTSLNLVGIFWTGTRVSCQKLVVWRIYASGKIEIDSLDKTLAAYCVAIPK